MPGPTWSSGWDSTAAGCRGKVRGRVNTAGEGPSVPPVCPFTIEWRQKQGPKCSVVWNYSPKKNYCRSAYHHDCRSTGDSVTPPACIPLTVSMHLHTFMRQPRERGNAAPVSYKWNTKQGLELWAEPRPHSSRSALISSGSAGSALHSSGATETPSCNRICHTLIIITPQRHKTPQDKGPKGICANNFWKINDNLLPPICFITLNSAICSGKV